MEGPESQRVDALSVRLGLAAFYLLLRPAESFSSPLNDIPQLLLNWDIIEKSSFGYIDEISPIGYQLAMEKPLTHSIRSLRQAAAALRARRRAQGMTQKQLAETTGTAQSTISDIETGVVSVSLDVYLRLLEALGADLTVTGRMPEQDTN